ncbi:Uncharacterised protein [Nocardia otitidiscaviarum]|uniref:Uncharacterized protein n=1 Tax=Nocardia otitidiscaviarum TaxID=1823 RepID=A0A378Y9X0_9NOCA|nr:hypothetical protein [Nocardia otitidiscaviarum]SUA73167.1 Uncharacterised protein [Nocardia otitidiscaviarum]
MDAGQLTRQISYIGSGPYCYANGLAMMMGEAAPGTAVIETVTGSPFGMQVGDGVAFFDPGGWNPEIGVAEALAALGWRATVTSEDDPVGRLGAALRGGPVFIGPVEMGYLRYQPEMRGPIGADHFLVVVDMDADGVTAHDPQGYPYARIELSDFLSAWRGDSVDYGQPYTMYTEFERTRVVGADEAVAACLPRARERLAGNGSPDAARSLAAMLADGCPPGLRAHLTAFAVRVGARRTADAADCLRRIGYGGAAAVMVEQARLIGSLQQLLVSERDRAAAEVVGELASTYERLRAALHQR